MGPKPGQVGLPRQPAGLGRQALFALCGFQDCRPQRHLPWTQTMPRERVLTESVQATPGTSKSTSSKGTAASCCRR